MQHKTKSRSFRKKQVSSINGTKNVYLKPRPSKAKCAETGKPLQGVPRDTPVNISKYTKSDKRPERPYGGVLCSEAARKKHKQAARNKEL